MNPMRILVRLVLNSKKSERISRCCATLSAIGCIKSSVSNAVYQKHPLKECIKSILSSRHHEKTAKQWCSQSTNDALQCVSDAATTTGWTHNSFLTTCAEKHAHVSAMHQLANLKINTARSSEDETRNGRRNGNGNHRWSPQVSFQTADSKNNLSFEGLFPSRMSICISTSILSLIFSGTGCNPLVASSKPTFKKIGAWACYFGTSQIFSGRLYPSFEVIMC